MSGSMCATCPAVIVCVCVCVVMGTCMRVRVLVGRYVSVTLTRFLARCTSNMSRVQLEAYRYYVICRLRFMSTISY